MARRPLALLLAGLLAALSAVLLPSRPAAAQNMLCKVAAGLPAPMHKVPGTYWAEAPVTVEGITLQLKFCAPGSQSIVADRMLDVAVRALPVLDELTDVPLDGSHVRVFYLDDTDRLREMGVEGFIDPNNQITLHEHSLDRTVVHELAHYWSDRDRFKELWLTEAYAEYLTSLALPRLDATFIPKSTPPGCDRLPLNLWQYQPEATALCGYAVGLQVFQDLGAAAGEDTLRQVIGQLVRDRGSVDSMRLLVELERASGASLSDLMRGRVFEPSYDQFLLGRAAIHARYDAVAALAGELGAPVPSSLAGQLNAWDDEGLAASLDALQPILETARSTRERCAALELQCARPWESLGPGPADWQALGAVLAGAPQLLDTYASLRAGAAELGLGLPGQLGEAAASLDFANIQTLQSAEQTLGSIRGLAARCAELGLVCRQAWEGAWNSGDIAGANSAVASLGGAFEAAIGLEQRCGDLAPRCRELWFQALGKGPTNVRATVEALDTLLADGAALEQRCGDLGPRCRELWRAALAGAGAAGDAQAAVSGLNDLLGAGESLEAACADLAPRCRELWRAALRDGAPGDARAAVDELSGLLAAGAKLAARCEGLNARCDSQWRAALARGSPGDADQAIKTTNALLDRGDALEARCAGAGWPCEQAWRAALRAGDTGRAAALLDAQEAALPGLSAPGGALMSLVAGDASPADGESARLLADAREAFARGDVVAAEQLAARARERELGRARLVVAVVVLGGLAAVAALAALAAAALRRRSRLAARGAGPKLGTGA